jgi:YfiH family protein
MQKPSDGFSWRQAPAGRALVCAALAPAGAHLFTTRAWTLGAPTPEGTGEAWLEVAQALGVDGVHLVRVHQVHGATVAVRRAGLGRTPGASPALPDADIIVSDDPELGLAIQAADCVPLLVADRRTGAAAAAHAGWRGLAARVPQVTVEAMAREFGSQAADLIAAIGPSISAARYEVGSDVRSRFDAGFAAGRADRWFSKATRSGHWFFDGWRSARDQLEAAGLPPGQIHVAGLCTAADAELFCSYRRDGNISGRMAAAIRPSGRRS